MTNCQAKKMHELSEFVHEMVRKGQIANLALFEDHLDMQIKLGILLRVIETAKVLLTLEKSLEIIFFHTLEKILMFLTDVRM